MDLLRKAAQALQDWKRLKTNQALLVSGARQVGKTYAIRAFAHENYEHVVEINLIDRPDAVEALSAARDANALFLRLTAYATGDVVPHKTLFFIDEVQECKEMVTALKFLVDRYGAEYDFVVSGSLLGVELKSIRSMPVGYLDIVEMFPLDFEEFCWANGVPAVVLEEACDACVNARAVDVAVDRRLTELFHQYLIVGGMPNAVRAFVTSHNVQQVRRIQEGIVTLYRHDISKYAGNRARAVRRIYDLMPAELNTQGKRFTLSHIEGSSRFDRYDNDFSWLTDAGVALPACNVAEPRYPLELSADSSYFKLFMSDVGLLTCACGMDVVRDLLNDRADINFGSIYENYVAQEFVAHGLCHKHPDLHLYFFRSRKLGELDFLVEHPRGRVLPVEVKSGKSYKRHSALSNALATENFGIDRAVVLHEGNVETDGKVTYLPMYATLVLGVGRGGV